MGTATTATFIFGNCSKSEHEGESQTSPARMPWAPRPRGTVPPSYVSRSGCRSHPGCTAFPSVPVQRVLRVEMMQASTVCRRAYL